MKRKIAAIVFLLTFMLCTAGCVKVVKIGEEAALTGKTTFNAGENVTGLWQQVKENIQEKSVILPVFLVEANGDLKSLADKYGKYSMGSSGSISYAVKGSGIVESVNQEKKAGYMSIKLEGYEGSQVIKLQIGSIYKGSSTRDVLDIINFGDYTNQEEWAAVSKELHTLIDQNVIQPVRPSELVGKVITFTGTFTADQNDELLITPIELMVD